MAAAVLMLVPIVMVVVSVTFAGQPVRWVHIVAAVGLLGVNLIGLPTTRPHTTDSSSSSGLR